ncbi:hypothetical protein HDV05_002379 [Chytridiales sp. JEL 0842]|nr:hypothetical protein HDV05_002379 [Chytridiales sp. JEL 0842]
MAFREGPFAGAASTPLPSDPQNPSSTTSKLSCSNTVIPHSAYAHASTLHPYLPHLVIPLLLSTPAVTDPLNTKDKDATHHILPVEVISEMLKVQWLENWVQALGVDLSSAVSKTATKTPDGAEKGEDDEDEEYAEDEAKKKEEEDELANVLGGKKAVDSLLRAWKLIKHVCEHTNLRRALAELKYPILHQMLWYNLDVFEDQRGGLDYPWKVRLALAREEDMEDMKVYEKLELQVKDWEVKVKEAKKRIQAEVRKKFNEEREKKEALLKEEEAALDGDETKDPENTVDATGKVDKPKQSPLEAAKAAAALDALYTAALHNDPTHQDYMKALGRLKSHHDIRISRLKARRASLEGNVRQAFNDKFKNPTPESTDNSTAGTYPTKVSPKRPSEIPATLPPDRKSPTVPALSRLLSALQPPPDFHPLRHRLLRQLQNLLNRTFPSSSKLTVHLFGSSANGLGGPSSDVDVTIRIPPGFDPSTHPASNVPFLSMLLRNEGMKDVVAITGAKVPLCKFTDPTTNLKCDLSVGNMLGVHNSRLLQTYCSIHPVSRPLILLVKSWAKERDLNDAGAGTVSSYAWSLMVINFLQRKGMLPALQQVGGKKGVEWVWIKDTSRVASRRGVGASEEWRMAKKMFYAKTPMRRILEERDGSGGLKVDFEGLVKWDTWFEANLGHPEVAEYVDQAQKEWKERCVQREDVDEEDVLLEWVTELFYEFAVYFGFEHAYVPNSVISVREGAVLNNIPQPLERGRFPPLVLVVEDPFQLDRNTTSMVLTPSILIAEFRRVASLLSSSTLEPLQAFNACFEKATREESNAKMERRVKAELLGKLGARMLANMDDGEGGGWGVLWRFLMSEEEEGVQLEARGKGRRRERGGRRERKEGREKGGGDAKVERAPAGSRGEGGGSRSGFVNERVRLEGGKQGGGPEQVRQRLKQSPTTPPPPADFPTLQPQPPRFTTKNQPPRSSPHTPNKLSSAPQSHSANSARGGRGGGRNHGNQQQRQATLQQESSNMSAPPSRPESANHATTWPPRGRGGGRRGGAPTTNNENSKAMSANGGHTNSDASRPPTTSSTNAKQSTNRTNFVQAISSSSSSSSLSFASSSTPSPATLKQSNNRSKNSMQSTFLLLSTGTTSRPNTAPGQGAANNEGTGADHQLAEKPKKKEWRPPRRQGDDKKGLGSGSVVLSRGNVELLDTCSPDESVMWNNGKFITKSEDIARELSAELVNGVWQGKAELEDVIEAARALGFVLVKKPSPIFLDILQVQDGQFSQFVPNTAPGQGAANNEGTGADHQLAEKPKKKKWRPPKRQGGDKKGEGEVKGGNL